MTFFTVQKSKASSSTQQMKPVMNESNSSTDSRYSSSAAPLNNTWKKQATLCRDCSGSGTEDEEEEEEDWAPRPLSSPLRDSLLASPSGSSNSLSPSDMAD